MREEVYDISGMHCAACSASVEKVTRRLPGVERSEGVYVSGVYLGSVADREALFSSLRQFITGQLPTWAETGYLRQELVTRPQYGRSGSQTPVEDMVLLVSGMAPVLYSDGQGYVASA